MRSVAQDHRGRLEKALRVLVRRQERFHFVTERLVAGARDGEVGRTAGRRKRARAREHLFQVLPIIRGEYHVPWILSPARGLERCKAPYYSSGARPMRITP